MSETKVHGDPCYIVKEDDWNDFLNAFYKARSEQSGHVVVEVRFKSGVLLVQAAADGIHDVPGGEVPVGSGLLCKAIITNLSDFDVQPDATVTEDHG